MRVNKLKNKQKHETKLNYVKRSTLLQMMPEVTSPDNFCHFTTRHSWITIHHSPITIRHSFWLYLYFDYININNKYD